MDISVSYYTDRTRISNSNIGWFIGKGPAYLHKMLTEDVPEEKSQALERGSMIHEYILQPDEFQKHYVVWNKDKPISAQQEKFCQELANTLEIEPNRAILSAYKEAYSTRGKSDDLMLSEGLKIASTLKDYIDFIKSKDDRIMISPWDAKMLEKIKHNIQSHKLAKNIIWPRNSEIRGLDIDEFIPITGDPGISPILNHHEFHINWDWYGEMPVACKSLLDGLTLDFKKKKAIIYDLKTTQKLWHFQDSMAQYDYGRQLMYYTMAVNWYLQHECDEDPKYWEHEWYIIGIDTTNMYDIRVFQFKKEYIDQHHDKIDKALTDIAWHQANNKWEHSREYYEGDGSEHLDV